VTITLSDAGSEDQLIIGYSFPLLN
jgi:hypothetical protein